MGILFLEYRVKPQFKQEFLEWSRGKRSEWGYELLEGSDQPGLFVELWRPLTAEEGAEWKRRRLDPENADWSVLHAFVEGGSGKVHVWHFEGV